MKFREPPINYYKVLGVNSFSPLKDIKTSYRSLVKKYHPDKMEDKKETEKNKSLFLLIQESYEVLSSEKTRSEYDSYIESLQTPTFTSFDWGKLFEKYFEEFTSNEDVNVFCRLTLEELKSGCEKTILLKSERLKVKIPPETKPKSVLKVEGKGNRNLLKSTKGDLLITVFSKPNSKFEVLDSGDLKTTVPVTYQTLMLGGIVSVKTLTSILKLQIPKLADIKKPIRLKGYGISSDLLVQLELFKPSKLSKSDEEIIKSLNKSTNLNPKDLV